MAVGSCEKASSPRKANDLTFLEQGNGEVIKKKKQKTSSSLRNAVIGERCAK